MPTIKLVVIGASGVGKTSLRGKYISGRFSNGYRATIGADFITKILPHPSNPAESVMLQIWDTAGQERFSSLSTAFFRGADAALLMFDVNAPHTMTALTKWWADFRQSAPLADEDMEDYCCVVVGNKVDLAGDRSEAVTEEEAYQFLAELVPAASSSSPSSFYHTNGLPIDHDENQNGDPMETSQLTIRPTDPPGPSSATPPQMTIHPTSNMIPITTPNHSPPSSASASPSYSLSYSPKHHLSKSRSRPSSHFYGSTTTTTRTTLTIYHTPSSSLFDVYQSARSSPEPHPSSASWLSSSESPSVYSSVRSRRMTTLSTESVSSGSVATITPSLFARENASASASTTAVAAETTETVATTPTGDNDNEDPFAPSGVIHPLPLSLPARGPKLFFTSAKTGKGVVDVFEYIVERVVGRWEYEERMEARRMHMRETSGADTIRIGLGSGERRRGGEGGKVFFGGGCC